MVLTIDGRTVAAPAGSTILAAAARLGITIPTICYHPSLTPPAVCRICVVEAEGHGTLLPACATPVADKLSVRTDSERVRAARRVVLELLSSTVDLHEAPEIQALMREYGADAQRFAGGRGRTFEVINDNPFYIRDYSQCVMCWRCIQVCADDVQNTFALTWGKRGLDSHVATFFEAALPDTTCVFCGNCVGVCPTGALKGLVESEEEQKTRDPGRER